MKPLRKIGTVALLLFCGIWLSLLFASYLFSKKPRACFAITTLPYAIESSGCFVLRSDLTLRDPSGTAILVRASNVRLDLDGHRITGPSETMVSGIGIAGYGVHDVKIENGTISGFLYGIRIEKSRKRSSERIILQNVALTGNTFRGATIEGKNTLIENMVVEHTGGSLFFPDAFSMGLELNGPDCRIKKNRIHETYPVGKGESIGISLGQDIQGCVIQDNELLNSRTEKNVKTIGILSRKESMPSLLNNKIMGFHADVLALCLAIPSLPYLIDAPGCYELRHDLELSDPSATGILIRSNNVRLDLRDYQIIGPADPHGSGTGIEAEGINNVLIENGIVRGFLYGLRTGPGLNGAPSNHFTLRKMAFLNNSFRGAVINAADTTVEDVTISNTGGSLFFPDSSSIGLAIMGSNCKISRNQVLETYSLGKGESIAIAFFDNTSDCLLENNRLVNSDPTQMRSTFGVWRKNEKEKLKIVGNTIEGFYQPSNFPIGIQAKKSGNACTNIWSIPYEINIPGCYIAQKDLEISDPAGTGILIQSSNVHLDMQGHAIRGPASALGSGTGIAVHGGQDIVLRNATISGFLYGVRAQSSNASVKHLTVQNITLIQNTFRGIAVDGKNIIIEDSTITQTGGSDYFPNASAIGIEVAGPECRIHRNRIIETIPKGKGQGIGILLRDNIEGCVVSANTIKNEKSGNATDSTGLSVKGSDKQWRVLNNRITGFTHPQSLH